MTSICYPNYNHSILSLISSVLSHYSVPTDYEPIPEVINALNKGYKNVVLLVFDAMGVNVLKKHLTDADFLLKHQIDTISSVFPPTTAAAMTVFYSGLPPISNGWLSSMCYFKEYDKVVLLYSNRDFYTGEFLTSPPVCKQVEFESIYSKIEKATDNRVKATELSPFNESKVSSITDAFERIEKICNEDGKQFILSYWPEPDSIMHQEGVESKNTKKNILDINSSVEKLVSRLKDTLVIVTADHGHINLEKELYIDDYPDLMTCLKHPLSFEDRVVSVFVKEKFKDKFKLLFSSLFSDEFLIFEKESVLKQNLFGYGKQHSKIDDFLGDFLIVSIKDKSLRQRGARPFNVLKGSHAGLTKSEMDVPLILFAP